MSCACQIANLHLAFLDRFVARSLSEQLFAYKRLIDDVLVLHDVKVSADHILCILNEFEAGIVITHDADEDPLCVHYLDLLIKIDRNSFSYATYRKPMNSYSYTPANSCHPPTVFDAVIATELCRLDRTCLQDYDFQSQCTFFFAKLGLRGYSLE